MRNHKQILFFGTVTILMRFNFIKIFAVSFFIPSLLGCAPTINNHGFDKEEIEFKKIIPSVSTRDDVQQLLGSPTSMSNFPPETWYYISKKTAATAFLPVKTLDQAVTEIVFSPNGVVTNVNMITSEEASEINPVNRQTATSGHQTSVLREIFSNFGRMAPKSSGQRS